MNEQWLDAWEQDEGEQAPRIIVYDPETGAPEDDYSGAEIRIPDNGRVEREALPDIYYPQADT